MKKLGFLAVLLLLSVCPAFAAHTVVLNWTASTDTGVTYKIYRAPGTIGSGNSVSCPATATPPLTGWTQITSGVTAVTYTDTGVSVGNGYCYYATSVLGGLESIPSNTATAVILPAPPTAVTATAN